MHVPEHLYYYEQGFLSSYFYALQTPDLSGLSSPYTLPHLRATPITPYYTRDLTGIIDRSHLSPPYHFNPLDPLIYPVGMAQ